jgi:hypothetical protein
MLHRPATVYETASRDEPMRGRCQNHGPGSIYDESRIRTRARQQNCGFTMLAAGEARRRATTSCAAGREQASASPSKQAGA